MKLKIKDKVHAQCKKCFAEFDIPSSSFNYEGEIVDKRVMGPEFQHTLYYNGQCKNCQMYYYFKIDAWEYPKDCINYTDPDGNGIIFDIPTLVNEKDEEINV